jgi:UTP--glucose-1-phosphate uridylyltransferase
LKIKKAVIPAAGFGTRFLPFTKSIHKALVPIVDKAALQYLVENCVEAGIEEVIFVVRKGNNTVKDYFSASPDVEKYLMEKGKTEELEKVRKIHTLANFHYIHQDPSLPYGNAAPIWSARKIIGDEPFIVSWDDDIIWGKDCGVKEIIDMYESQEADCILNCTRIDAERMTKLGMVILKDEKDNIVEKVIEKPTIENVVSDICSMSPYLFTPGIFDTMDPKLVKDGEFKIQDGINQLIKTGIVRAKITKGKWLTTGDPQNYLKDNVEIALDRDEYKEEFKRFLKNKVSSF